METFGFLVSLGHLNYNNRSPHISLENVFSLFHTSERSAKIAWCQFLAICRSLIQQIFRWSWLSTTWHCFPWLLSLKSRWLKSKPSLGKGWQRHMRHPLAYRKRKLLQAWEPTDVSEEKVPCSTLSPGTGNAIVMKVTEERRHEILKERAKREEGLEKASVRGSGALQIEKLPQQSKELLEMYFQLSASTLGQSRPDSGVFRVIFQLITARLNQTEIRLCLHFILEITQSFAPPFNQYSPSL